MASPRLSIIPASAVTDKRLTPRALQVLCLLGRHMDDSGWLRVRQTRLAEELGCARSTVQDALDLLYEAGWVEMQRQGRPGAADPDAVNRPYASHAYRVVLDTKEAPSLVAEETESDGGVPDQSGTGCPIDRHPVPTHTSAPNERSFNNEDERETRARENGIPVKKFKAVWPTANTDSHAAIEREWGALSSDDRQGAIDGVERFLSELARHGRRRIPSGATYLRERKWNDLPARDEVRHEFVSFRPWSQDWWAWFLAKVDRGEQVATVLERAKQQLAGTVTERAGVMPCGKTIEALKAYPSDGFVMAAWRPWFESRGLRLPQWRTQVWVFLPGPEPPMEGQPALGLIQSTGPPQAAE